MIAKVADWVILFIDYHNMKIEDITITIKLLLRHYY